MMMHEFEKLTGLQPTDHEYSVIESMYYDFDGDKKAFCKWFTANNGMITVLQTIVKDQAAALEKLADNLKEANDTCLKNQYIIEALQAQLEKEQEWQPYELEDNCSQKKYDELSNSSSRKELTDQEAIDLIADEFGFSPSRIRIIHSVKQYEVNRHGHLRCIGYAERKALYDATDWNYIRFDVDRWSYEMVDGDLRKFYF